MRRRAFAVVMVVSIWVCAAALAQTNDGYVGIYSDSSGTLACTTVPQGTGKTLYVTAKTTGASANGITGAEFRIEVTNPSGWYLAYSAPTGALTLGTPLDLYPNDPNDGSGLNIAFSSCQQPVGGNVFLGTIFVFNAGGSPTNLLVRRHSHPSNAGFACPLFVKCDEPNFTKYCMTPSTEPPCSLTVAKSHLLAAGDPTVFVGSLNTESLTVPSRPQTSVMLGEINQKKLEMPVPSGYEGSEAKPKTSTGGHFE